MLFEKAVRLRLRFDSPQGQLSVEDLWELPLTSTNKKQANLDDLAIHLNKEFKETNTESFVKKSVKSNEVVKLKFDIVLKVIEAKQVEAEAASQKRTNAEKKQRLTEILAQKQDESLKGKSIEEIQALIDSM